MALAGVGFSRVVVWLEGCILGRSGESEGWIWVGRGWIVVQLRLVVWIIFEGCQVFVHSPELLPGFVCLLPDDAQARLL